MILTTEQQQVAVDIAAAASLIITRLPGISGAPFDAIAEVYGDYFGIDHQKAKEALAAIGAQLFNSEWELLIRKNQERQILTHFVPAPGVEIPLTKRGVDMPLDGEEQA